MTSLVGSIVDQYWLDWLDLLIRWLHVIAAIAWIGASFYFVLLDQSLRLPDDPADERRGVAGELWEVHGGGFYHVQKYRVAPPSLPSHLAWFKWEAYATWISGFALLVVLFYLDADASLVDPTVVDLSAGAAVAISIALLVAAWLAYDLLCRALGGHEPVLWASIFAGSAFAAWVATELFAPRAAFLQVGAMLGTIMTANVFFVIIPAHWELIRAKQAFREPDPRPGLEAKRRSVHNNYLTLPVLLTMLAGHFPFAYGATRAWLVLLVLILLGAWARLFFNLRHHGRTHWWMPIAAGVAVVVLAVAIKPDDESDTGPPPEAIVTRGAEVFASAGCGSCHTLAAAGASGNVGPNLDAARPSRSLVAQRVTFGQGAMPAFAGQLSADDIDAVAAYVADTAGKDS